MHTLDKFVAFMMIKCYHVNIEKRGENMKETVRINITITKEEREEAKKRAQELGLSMSSMLRMLLVRELNAK